MTRRIAIAPLGQISIPSAAIPLLKETVAERIRPVEYGPIPRYCRERLRSLTAAETTSCFSWCNTTPDIYYDAGERLVCEELKEIARVRAARERRSAYGEGLAEAEAYLRDLLARGIPLFGGEGTCRTHLLDQYDIPCTPGPVFANIFIESLYEESQRRLQTVLGLTRSPVWFDVVRRWLSVAHVATATRPAWLFAAEDVPTRWGRFRVFGPRPVREYVKRLQRAAEASGRRLLIPMPNVFAGFQRDPGRAMPLRNTLGASVLGGDVRTRGEICLKRGAAEADCWAYIFCAPAPALGPCEINADPDDLLQACLRLGGSGIVPLEVAATDPRIRSEVTTIARVAEEAAAAGLSYAIPTAATMYEILRLWSNKIVATSMKDLLEGEAFPRYLEVLIYEAQRVASRRGTSFEAVLGMSEEALRATYQQALRSEAREVGERWGSYVGIAEGRTTDPVAKFFVKISRQVGEFMANFLPLAEGCPWMPPIFLYRCPLTDECNLDPRREGGSIRMLDALENLGRQAGYTFKNPFRVRPSVDDVPDTSGLDLEGDEKKGWSPGVVIAGAAAVGLVAVLLLR